MAIVKVVDGSKNPTNPALSPDGRMLAFTATASDLVPGIDPGRFIPQLYLEDLQTGTVSMVSVALGGRTGGNDASGIAYRNGSQNKPVFSPNGSTIAFSSAASNLVVGDTNGAYDIFTKDLRTGTPTRISTSSSGAQLTVPAFSADQHGFFDPVFSPDGTKIAFDDGRASIYVKDLVTGALTLVSTDTSGRLANQAHDP